MDSYIINKRKSEKLTSILSVVFWVINLLFLEVSVSMLLKILVANNSSWFDMAAKSQVSNDPFFLMRTDMIVNSIVIIMLVIIVFSGVSIVIIRRMQLKNMCTQMGICVVLGYSKQRIIDMCFLDALMDICLALPVAVILSSGIWKLLESLDTIHSLLMLMGNRTGDNVIPWLVLIVYVVVIVLIHTKLFINKTVKKGVRYMLGKGVV